MARPVGATSPLGVWNTPSWVPVMIPSAAAAGPSVRSCSISRRRSVNASWNTAMKPMTLSAADLGAWRRDLRIGGPRIGVAVTAVDRVDVPEDHVSGAGHLLSVVRGECHPLRRGTFACPNGSDYVEDPAESLSRCRNRRR